MNLLRKVIYKFLGIDESGDLANESRYFVLVAFLYEEESLSRKIRKYIQKLNHKKNKNIGILHARKDSDVTRTKNVKFLSTFNWSCVPVVVDKKTEQFDYHKTLRLLLDNVEIASKEKIFITLPNTQDWFRGKYERNYVHYFNLLSDKIWIFENSKTPVQH